MEIGEGAYIYVSQYRCTFAVPKFLTTQANMAVFPLITVTLVGVVASMNGAKVVVLSGVGVVVVVMNRPPCLLATGGGPVYGGKLLRILGSEWTWSWW